MDAPKGQVPEKTGVLPGPGLARGPGMMTLTTAAPRAPLAHDLPLKAWLGALRLLSAGMMFTGLGGLTLLLTPKTPAAWPEVDLGVSRVPFPMLLAGGFCVGLALDHWRHWQVKQVARRGWELLLAGRLEAAIRALQVARYGGSDDQRARSLHGLTLAWLHKGDYARALALGEEATRAWGKGTDLVRNTQAPALMATILALSGELDDASEWVEHIQRPMFDKTDHALLAQAVMLCREGKDVEAVKRIQRTAREDVPELDVGAVAVIHAFARSRLGGQQVPLKPGCILPHKPARASGYEYLAREWPELAAFLQRDSAPAHGG